jgi:hypothetical protein
MGEFETHQMVAVGVRNSQGSSPKIAGRLGQRICGRQWRTGDLKQNLRGERQRAANGNQGATRGDVQRGGEFQKFFSFFVPATNEDGYGDGEARPFAALCFRIQTLQTDPFLDARYWFSRTLGAKPAIVVLPFAV